MRNNLLKDLRQETKKDSRFFFGKNRIMQIGLGRTEAEEIEPQLHKLSNRLTGQCGLLFTERSKQEILDWAKDYWAVEYARGGFKATETVILPAGPMEEFAHSIEPHLRKLGMPTKLEKGIVTLFKSYTVCEEGKVLTPEQARILKLIAKPMAEFRLTIKCGWNKKDGFESYISEDSGNEEGDDDEDDENDVEMDDE
ncbi:MRTO4 family protein [Megaselia abdita]